MDGMAARVVNATPSELLVITYEITLDSLERAIKAIKDEDEKQLKRYTYKAQSLVRELMNTLNMSYEVSLELMSLYLFVNKSLIQGFVKKDTKHLENAKKVLNILKGGWDTVSEEHKNEQRPMVANAQRLVAGLTYGKGMLNESVINSGSSRGFKA